MSQKAEKNIISIILSVWEANRNYELLVTGAKGIKSFTFNIWVSFIMTYGYGESTILKFAEKYGIKHDPDDCDPDDPTDEFGALELNEKIIKKLKEIDLTH